MVSMINFYAYKEDVKRALIRRKERLNIDDYPMDWAWITYAFNCEGTEDNPLLGLMLEQGSRWAISEKAVEYDRNVGALGIFCFVLNKAKHRNYEEINNLILGKVKDLTAKKLHKFHPLNDPEIVFGLSIGLGKGLSKEVPNPLLKHLKEGASSESLKRRLFFTAALIELGAEAGLTNLLPPADQIRVDELIPAIWFVERYASYSTFQQTKSILWGMFAKSKEFFSLESYKEADISGQRISSSAELAMLYEALVLETREPDPGMLFDVYPLHPRVREIAKHDFKNKSYTNAVDQAAKVLNELIQDKTEVFDKSEAELVQSTMKPISQLDRLKIKFNEYLREESGKNEQAGLALITEGIFKAFRNPKGHKPKDHPIVQVDAYEAMNQLITISYIMNRIEKATKRGKNEQ